MHKILYYEFNIGDIMILVITYIACFIVGLLAGFCCCFMWAIWTTTRHMLPANSPTDLSTQSRKTIKTTMQKVNELIAEQEQLLLQINKPSQNALHSKHKNSLITRLKQIDEEKYKLLNSILNAGFDPVIVMRDPDSDKLVNVKLSELLARANKRTSASSKPSTKPKLRVVTDEGFENDDDPNSTAH